MQRFINNGANFIDNFCSKHSWLDQLAINDYHLLAMLWNFFLIIIPFTLVYLLDVFWRKTKFSKLYQKIIALIVSFFWLLFIPNTIYIVSDIRHLLDYCPADSAGRVCVEHAWMIAFFFLYGSLGWVFFVYLLRQMSALLEKIYGLFASKVFILAIMPLISLGVLLGLINRWNSWDIFIRPVAVANNSLIYFSNFSYLVDWLIFTVFLYILYYLGKLLFKKNIKLSSFYR